MWKYVCATVYLLLLSLERCHTSDFSKQPSPLDNIYAQEGGGVWEFPRGCTTDCKRISWVSDFNGTDFVVRFQVTTLRAGYVAIAISTDTEMGYDDAYICSKDPSSSNSGVYSAYLNNHTHPIFQGEVPDGNITWEDDRMTCEFSRLLSVTKEVSNLRITWDMAINNYNILYAEGSVDDTSGMLHHHTFRTSTHKAFDLHRNAHYPRAPEEETRGTFRNVGLSPGNLSDSPDSVHSADAIYSTEGLPHGMWFVANEDECPNGKNCTHIHWQRVSLPGNPNLVRFAMIGRPSGWMALAISSDTTMGDDDCYICSKNSLSSETSSQFSSAYLTGTAPPVILSQMEGVHRVHHTLTDDRLVCIFHRNISVTKNVSGTPITWDLSRENFNLLYAEGETDMNGRLLRHSFTKHTHKRFNFLNTDGYKSFEDFKSTATESTLTQVASSSYLSEVSSTNAPNSETSVFITKLSSNAYNSINNATTTNHSTNEFGLETNDATTKLSTITQKTSTLIQDGKIPRRDLRKKQFDAARWKPVPTTTKGNSASSSQTSYLFLTTMFLIQTLFIL